jgi:hypothetical protein
MKIVVGMATTNNRASFCEIAVESLVYQADEIIVYNNSNEDHDYTDNAKFHALTLFNEPVYYFSCDDDILYPADYVSTMIEAIERTGTIVTHHGRKLLGLDKNYYREHQGFRCLDENNTEQLIDVAGTGVTAFRTDYFNPKEIYKATDKRMSDLVFSLEVAKQGKEITLLKHAKGWLKDLRVPNRLSISFMECRNTRQTQLANEIYNVKRTIQTA